MIKRRPFLTALICIILSLITAFCFAFTGCAEYTPPENIGGDPVLPDDPEEPTDPDNPEEPEEDGKNFTVQLIVKNDKVWQNFTYEFYEASDGMNGAHKQGWIPWESIKIQWTDQTSGARHFAGLDEQGKSVCTGLDGDYDVTIMNVPTGFTYESNGNYADNNTKGIEIVLYQIQKTGASVNLYYNDGSSLIECLAYNIKSTGVYRAVLENKDDRVMYAFQTNQQGTYSLTTLVDITENKVNPKLTVYNGNLASKAIYHFEDKDDGSEFSNTYTKNVYWNYYISADETKGSNALIFELYSTSLDGNSSYPLTVDFLIQRDGDYTRTEIQSVNVEVTEDFSKTPPQPNGTFTWAVNNPENKGQLLCDSKAVILNTAEGRTAEYLKNIAGGGNEFSVAMGTQATLDDGYYYFYEYDESTKTFTLTDRLYAVIDRSNPVVDLTDSQIHFNYLNGHNYVSFLATYREHCNSDGAYPVNAELAQFLYDYCLSYNMFNDGYGYAEEAGYISDENGMWIFSCAYYKQ